MSHDAWNACSVCAGKFKPESARPDRPILYRCVTCTDLASTTKDNRHMECLHICASCHVMSTLYHASSHCWAKVFVLPQKDAYAYAKGRKWNERVSQKAMELAMNSEDGYNEGLSTILDHCHYIPCSKCSLTIYGTRWIACSTLNSYCGDCWDKSQDYDAEDVWFMRSSIFHNAPANGPAISRPTLADMPKDEKPKEAQPPSRPAAGFGFGAPRVEPPPARVHVHVPGENYNDYLSTEDKAATSQPAPEPVNFADPAAESYNETMAIDLKRTNAYYDDNDDASDTTGGYIDESTPVPSSNPTRVTISAPAAYSNNSAANSTTSGGYTDDSTTGGYADDGPSTAAYTDDSGVSVANTTTVGGYTDDSGAGYSDDTATTAASTTGGYTDDDSGAGYADSTTPSTGGYTDDSGAGYTDDAVSTTTATTGGYTDDGATVGYSEDQASTSTPARASHATISPATPNTRVTIIPPASSSVKAPASYSANPAYASDSASGGYTDDSNAGSVGYTADQSTGAGYEDDGAVQMVASTGGYTDDSAAASTAAYIDDSGANTAAYSDDGVSTGGYTDDSSNAQSGAAAYIDSSDTQSSARPSSSIRASASYTDSAGYSDDTGGYTDNSADSTGGYADDSRTSAAPGYSDDSSTGGYADDGGGYVDSGASTDGAVRDPFRAVAQKPSQVTYTGSDAASYGNVGSEGYSDNASVGYGSGASDIGGYNSGPAAGAVGAAAPRPAPVKPAADGSRDWNEEFQQTIAEFRASIRNAGKTSTQALESCRDLYQLSLDFVATAQDIGRTIIEEVSIPASAKTIKPANVGGIAGGEKYVQRGIFFKFAIDAFGVYGGDEFAQKAAGHELAGLKAYYNCTIEGLNTPFMLLMDYRGYRLIATTKLPLSGASLIYGSADGGITVHKDDPVLNEMMKAAAAKLNIKPHVVGMRNQTDTLYAPTDIEGHKGGDGRYYVLDTARICPPEPIHKSFTAVILPPEDPYPAVMSSLRLWHSFHQQDKPTTGEFWHAYPPLREVGLTTERWLDQIYAHLGIANNGTVVAASEEFGEGLLYHIKQENMLSAVVVKEGQNRNVNVRASNLVGKVIHGTALLVLRGRKGAQLFNLLRYETVKRNSVPLSSDAFTPFGKHSRDIHNEEVENCFYDILSTTIPNFLNTGRLFPHAAGALKAIQQAGINTRMIGFLRSSIQDTMPNAVPLRAWLLNEMIVRVTKNYLRSKLRRATLKLKPIEPIIIKRFNLLLGSSTVSSFFWSTEMKAQIVNKFGRNGQALTPTEMKTETDLRTFLNKLALFQLLQSKIGVVFTEEANGRFQVDPKRFEVRNPLTEKDLSKLTVLQKSLLQPELDDYILRTAVTVSKDDPEKLLELSGTYLPQASAHPALALQRLHIAEKLLMEVTSRVGSRFSTNFLYSSNVDPIVHLSESTPDYLRNSKPLSNSRLDGTPLLLNEGLIDFLENMPEYKEVLSHLEVLRIWVEATPYCPLEVTCKLFYLRGCLAYVHRLWTTAEAFLKTSYDIITRVTHVPGAGSAQTYATGYITVDNDRPFSLLILDRLIHVLIVQDRPLEAVAFSEKFVRQITESSFPGTYADLRPIFGPKVPIAFTVYRTMNYGRDHIPNTLDPFEKELLKDKVVNKDELAAWVSRVFVTNFSELSGFFMSPAVFQQYLDEHVYLTSTAFPRFSTSMVPWAAQSASRETGAQHRLDVVIRAPPVLIASPEPRDIRVTFFVHRNRMEYADRPVRLVLMKNTDYLELTRISSDRRYFVSEDNVVATHIISDPYVDHRGTIFFRDVVLPKPGAHMFLVVDGKNGLISSINTLASQVIQVIDPKELAGPLVFSHDLASNHWALLRNLPSEHIESIAISDSDYEAHSGDGSPAHVIIQDTNGKVWESKDHNWMQQPIGLLRGTNVDKNMFKSSWSVIADLMAWKVKKVSVSIKHTLVLTDNGEVLSMGKNTHGELGHGDTVDQSDPRLVRRLKGKQITNVFAAENSSAILDAFGTVYQFGIGFTTLPEPHPYFSGKSPASKGKTITIANVIYQASRIPSVNEERSISNPYRTFWESRPIVYLSITGQAYIWAPNEKFFGTEYEPETVTQPDEAIVDAAVGSRAMAFLTMSGAVYTVGTNKDGELGVGYGTVSHQMDRGAYRADIPYGCARKVVGLDDYKVISLRAAQEKFFALTDMGEYFEWGARGSWAPATPAALAGLRVVRIDTGLRGVAVHVDMKATLPLPPTPVAIEVGFQQQAALASSQAGSILGSSDNAGNAAAAAIGSTPKPDIVGTVFRVEYVEGDIQPDFKLIVEVPKTKLGSYILRIVRPGETEKFVDVYSAELNLNMNSEFQCTIIGEYEGCRWGKTDVVEGHRFRPPMAAGEYEALILTEGEHHGATYENSTIHYRSPKFTIRPRTVKYKLSVSPERPAPASQAIFTITPKPEIQGSYFYIAVRPESNPTMTYGLISVDPNSEEEYSWTAMMPGKYTATFEYSINPAVSKLDVYDSVEFEVGTAKEEVSELELEAMPSGPYHCGQSVVLDWKYTKNPPKAGATVYGGAYKASDKGMSAMMQGAYASFASHEGMSTIVLPAMIDEFEYRVQCVIPGSGIEVIASFPISIIAQTSADLAQKIKALQPAVETPTPAPDSVPSSSSVVSTSDAMSAISGATAALNLVASATADVLTAMASSSTVVASPSAPSTLTFSSFENWADFFTACGLDKGVASAYSRLCKNFPISKLHLVDGGILISMKILDLEHQLAIMEKLQELRRNELQAWITRQLAAYAATLSPGLD